MTLTATVFGIAIASDGATEQGAAFAVTALSILAGGAAGLAAALLAGSGLRRRGLRWAGANVLVGLVCAALELIAAINTM